MADSNKDTLYIDIDDEITTVIDKVRSSSGKVVALVLPKRATTLQSIVNMKLLKRAGDEAKKNLVLVTTESGLMPLAGAVGLHVASTPTSRPEIPAAPNAISSAEEQVDEMVLDDETDTPPPNKPVSELAGAAVLSPKKPDSGVETLELDNSEPVAPAAAAAASKAPKPKKDKKLAVPNFDRFRLVLIFGGALLVALIVLGYLAFFVLPKATIDIKTNASNINTDVNFTLSTSAAGLSTSSKIVPAKQVSVQKTYTGMANATGQQNNGDKATGSVTMTAQECAPNLGSTPSVPAGTGISTGGNTYITQQSASFAQTNARGSCINYRTTSPVSIKAQNAGAKYNTDDNSSFNISGHSDVTNVSGSASGGTDDIQTIVSQADIDSAKGKINADDSSVRADLSSQLSDLGYYAIATTYVAGSPATTSSANAGAAASGVTVTEVISYTMLGAKQDDLKTLVDNDIKSQIDTSQQGILDEGLSQSGFKVVSSTSTATKMNLQTTAEVGPSINTTQIASDATGKKKADIENSIKSNPDVTDVTVKLSPFWVTKAPKASKITVNVAKPTASNAQ